MLKIICEQGNQIVELEIDSIRHQDPAEIHPTNDVLSLYATGADLQEICDQFEAIPKPSRGKMLRLGEEAGFVWRGDWAQLIFDNLLFGVDLEPEQKILVPSACYEEKRV
jgi:hypothetical protein